LRHLRDAGKFNFEEEFFEKYFFKDDHLQKYIAEYEENVPKSKEVYAKELLLYSFTFALFNIFILKISAECENMFKAVDEKKSNVKNSHLDIVGIVGATCTHGIPMRFVNVLSGGEKYVLSFGIGMENAS
jgi:hypothetical protein